MDNDSLREKVGGGIMAAAMYATLFLMLCGLSIQDLLPKWKIFQLAIIGCLYILIICIWSVSIIIMVIVCLPFYFFERLMYGV